jgi:hypothetical protein
MKRPGWVTTIGVLGIVFGSFGILNAGRTMLLPWLLEFQKEFLGLIAERMVAIRGDAGIQEGAERLSRLLWGNIPPWFSAWSVGIGVAGMLVCGFYLYAAISLLLMRRGAVPTIYAAFGACIVLNLVKGVVFGATFSLIGLATAVGAGFGIVVDGVLLLVVVTSDKKSLFPQEAPPGFSPLRS